MSPSIDHSNRRAPVVRTQPHKVGDVVVLEEFPAGFPRWRIAEVPFHPLGSDVATLERLDPEAPVRQLRRYVSTLRIVEP